MDSLVITMAIGLIFVFAVTALVTSVLTEGVARFLGLRAEFLLRGLRSMLDGGGDFKLRWPWNGKHKDPTDAELKPTTDRAWVARVLAHPLIRASAYKTTTREIPQTGNVKVEVTGAGDRPMHRKERRKLPSYISSRSFAEALVDLIVPDANGTTTIDNIRTKVLAWDESTFLRQPILTLLTNAGNDITKFRQELESWCDDQMARVSGWYKRHTRWILLTIGFALIVAFNINAIAIGQALYADQALREAVVTEAVRASDCSGQPPGQCLGEVRDQLATAQTLGLPLGWQAVERCTAAEDCSWFEKYGLADPNANGGADVVFLLTVLAGFALMVLSLLPGARFWFDLLSRLGSLRSTGPKPDRAPTPT